MTRLTGVMYSKAGDDLPLPEIYLLGVFSVDVQGLGLLGKIKDNAVEHGAQVG